MWKTGGMLAWTFALPGRVCWVTRQVTAVRQNPGLTARNSSHGELTAIDHSADHRTRGDAQTPRDSGLRNPLAGSLEHHEPHKRTGVYYQDT